MSSDDEILLLPVPWDHPDGLGLRAAQQEEIASLIGRDPGAPLLAEDISFFLIAYRAGKPIGCGGLRPLSESMYALRDAAEIKRMFVDPAQRGCLNPQKGPGFSVAETILTRLEDESIRRDWTLLLLETGASMAASRRFYERCGYVQRDMVRDYGQEDETICYEKRLRLPQ